MHSKHYSSAMALLIFLLRSKSIQIEPANIAIAVVYIYVSSMAWKCVRALLFCCIRMLSCLSPLFFLLLLFCPKWFPLVKLAIGIVPPSIEEKRQKKATAAAAAKKELCSLFLVNIREKMSWRGFVNKTCATFKCSQKLVNKRASSLLIDRRFLFFHSILRPELYLLMSYRLGGCLVGRRYSWVVCLFGA